MADDIQQPVGALAAASGQAAPAEDVFQVDYEQSRQALRNQQARLDQRREQLMAAMEGRKNRLFDPSLMRLAQGLLSPTKTGSFGESLGYGVGAMADEQEREFARQAQDARLMYELEQSSAQQKKEEMLQNREEMEYRRQQKIRDLSGNLVDFKTDEKTGAVTYNVNPMIAQQLTKLTGDMKYADKLIADAQMKTEQKVASSIFEEKQIPATNTEPAKILLKFNPQALLNLTKVSTNPIETIAKYTKIIPDLRKSGLVVFEGVSDNGTPFDAIATMIPDPAIKAQAERLAKQYKEGRLDEDKANTLAQQMLSMATSHMDKQAQRELTQAIAGLNVGMRQQSLAIQAELAQQRIDEKKKTEEQKRIAAQQAQKALFDKADDTIKAVEEIRVHPGRASGVWQAYRPSQIVPGTDAYDFGKQLDVIKSKSFLANVQEMRGMGALSNKEGDKITDAIAKLEPRMSKEAFDKSLDEIVRIMERAKQRAQDIAEGRRPTFEEEKPSGSKAPTGSAPRKFTVIRD